VSILIVLYGQENEPDGKLRFPAVARCAKAAEVFKDLSRESEVSVLPTGGFGAHFNTSDHPHSDYLTRELIGLGVPESQILRGTLSSNTLQDSTEAWYTFKKGGFDRLVAVTSDYHAPRVAFLLNRLSAGDNAEIELVSANTPASYDGEDKKLEPQKIEKLKREWVDVIRRNSNVPQERFVSVYEEAGREKRHFATLSAAIVAAMLVINGFAFLIVPGKDGWLLFLMLIGLAVIDFVLFAIYYRMSEAGRTARRVLTRMEMENRMPGFSSNWRTGDGEFYRTPPWLWSMRDLIAALAILSFLTLALVSLLWPATSVVKEPVRTYSNSAVSNSASASPTPYVSPSGNSLDRWTNRVLGNDENANVNANTGRRRRR
jgi:hypothetical protein